MHVSSLSVALGYQHTDRVIYLRRLSFTPPTYILVQIFQVTNLPSPPLSTLLYHLTMNLSAHTLRDPPASASMGLPARLLHTLFVFCATILMLVIAVISFLFVLLFKSITPAPGPRRSAGRHVTFLEPSTVITLPPSGAVAQRSPANGAAPSLSLTATPHELEPPTPDVAEDPLRALVRICGFLASNTARAWRGEELAATPPLAGLAPYLDNVKDDLERISEMEKGEEEGKEIVGGAGGDSEVVAAAGESAGAGAGADADADAHDEPGLVRPDRAATYARPPTPTPPSPLTPPVPNTSTSTSIPTPTPTPPASEPTAQHAATTPADTTITTETATATTTTTTTTTPGPRKRKDAVLRTKRPSIDPSNADALADADDAAVRAAALLSRVADLGAGLFDGAVRERGAALWTALSRRGTPTDVPVPPLPRTRFAGPAGERS